MTGKRRAGFVFLDANGRPFKCAMYHGQRMLFWWHPDKHWVTLRKVLPGELSRMPRNMSNEHQRVYDEIHERNTGVRQCRVTPPSA